MDVGKWEKAVDGYLLPALGDGWRAADGRLVRGLVGWTAQTVQPLPPLRQRPTFQVEVIVWLLAVPMTDGYTCSRRLDGVFPEPDALAGYEPVMADIRDAVLREGVPFLDRYGDVEGFLAHQLEREAREAERGLSAPEMRASEQLVYLHVIRGDWDAALVAAAQAEEAGELNRSKPHPLPWKEESLARVRAVIALGPAGGREALARNAAATAAALSLPYDM
ncbi:MULTISPECIES: hypothetical protein [unclassified Micromonospora]|uniref:hypothetical protein n=1 Tax=unclassified Micromonospora TaxID=2617518 RepID=UPI0022B73A38|nr:MULTISPECIES: hypothetical protein [unclassified Micromonospora]MCZ7423603.1 hypothetical protein [Verrucosispora sp. WMMA2121]WBB91298.1 hypothetical protein O7597_30800 [Verrucosispora sp. WMMC514]